MAGIITVDHLRRLHGYHAHHTLGMALQNLRVFAAAGTASSSTPRLSGGISVQLRQLSLRAVPWAQQFSWGPRREWLSGLPAASPDSFPGNWAQHSGPDNILCVLRCPEQAGRCLGMRSESPVTSQQAASRHMVWREPPVLRRGLGPAAGLPSAPAVWGPQKTQVLGVSRNPSKHFVHSPCFLMRTPRSIEGW